MKKPTLLLCLVILIMSTSCNNKDTVEWQPFELNNNVSSNSLTYGDIEIDDNTESNIPSTPSTEDNIEIDDSAESNIPSAPSTEDDISNDFIAASGTTYILHPVKVREKAKKSSATIGVADWGSAVELVERNQTWTKIKFTDKASGAVLEGYVRNELLTGDKKAVTMVAIDPVVEAKIVNLGKKQDGTAITLNVRTTPWNCSESEEYTNINVLANISNKKYSVQDGDVVEKLGTTEDGKWVRIRFTKTVDGAEKVEYGWCAAKYVGVDGETVDTPVTDPNTPPAIDPIA